MKIENEFNIQDKAGLAEEAASLAHKVLGNDPNDFYAEILIESAAEQTLQASRELEQDSMRLFFAGLDLRFDFDKAEEIYA